MPPARGRSRGDRTDAAQRNDTRGTDRPSIISDLTTPIARTKQLVPQKRGRLVVAIFSVVIALAIGAALFVLPVKSWFQQRDQLATRTGELETLNAANDQLQSEVERLQTDDGIREAARAEIDFVEAGEERLTVLPPASSATVLPTGWPYNLISTIVSLRQAEADDAAAAAVAATAPETTVAETTAPETTAPETTVPETTAPETTVADTATTAASPTTAVSVGP